MYYEKTYETREELLILLDKLNEEVLHQKKGADQWSISENVEHLALISKCVV